ncbi:hypothetical protein ACJX0J_026377 [Zea mays]
MENGERKKKNSSCDRLPSCLISHHRMCQKNEKKRGLAAHKLLHDHRLLIHFKIGLSLSFITARTIYCQILVLSKTTLFYILISNMNVRFLFLIMDETVYFKYDFEFFFVFSHFPFMQTAFRGKYWLRGRDLRYAGKVANNRRNGGPFSTAVARVNGNVPQHFSAGPSLSQWVHAKNGDSAQCHVLHLWLPNISWQDNMHFTFQLSCMAIDTRCLRESNQKRHIWLLTGLPEYLLNLYILFLKIRQKNIYRIKNGVVTKKKMKHTIFLKILLLIERHCFFMDGYKINQTITIDVKVLMAIKGRKELTHIERESTKLCMGSILFGH